MSDILNAAKNTQAGYSPTTRPSTTQVRYCIGRINVDVVTSTAGVALSIAADLAGRLATKKVILV